MSFWSTLLGREKQSGVDWHVQRGIEILDRSIQYGPGLVKCHYKKGEKARSHFKKAVELEPQNGHLHMLYAVAHFYCAEPKQAKIELKQACQKDPTNFEIRGLLEHDPWWRDVFHAPTWSPAAARIPPILAEKIKGKVVLPVRAGAQRVHSFFFRRQSARDFPDSVSREVRCRVYPYIIKSPYLSGLAVIGCVNDNPQNPLKAEAFIFPGSDDEGKEAMIQMMQLARQDCAYIVVIDPDNRVVFNAQAAFDSYARETFAQAAELAPALQAQARNLERLEHTVQWYQTRFSLDDVKV